MRKIYAFLMMIAVAGTLWSCTGAKTDVASRLADASSALSAGEWGEAQTLCDGVFALLSTEDSTLVGERQAGELAIMYMKLSEHRNEDENVALATMALRHAFRMSADSLATFSHELPLEDQRHFVLLRRIGFSIDNPVDLTDVDFMEDGLPAEQTDSLMLNH